jgi:hypothetical protein
MSVVKLRIEIERALRELSATRGSSATGPASIGVVLRELQQQGLAPPSTPQFLESLHVMNKAAHGLDVDTAAAEQAMAIANQFLAELNAANQ